MQTRRNLKNINPKNTKKSPTHENTNAKIPCDFGDDRCRIAAARLEKDICEDRIQGQPSYSSKDYVWLLSCSKKNGRWAGWNTLPVQSPRLDAVSP